MDKMEKIWHNLWRRKKKKFSRPESEAKVDENKENDATAAEQEEGELERITVKSSVVGDSKTFPRSFVTKPEAESSPALPRLKRDPVASSAVSLRCRRFEDPYDRNKWTSTQHFHLPLGTRPRHASSRGGLSITSTNTSSRRNLRRPQSSQSLRPTTPAIEATASLRRPVEPSDKIRDQTSGLQHFHLPAGQRRLTYNREGRKGGMTRLVNTIQTNSLAQPRYEDTDYEEPIQLAQYPGGLPAKQSQLEDLPTIFPFSDQERKRRRSGSAVSRGEDSEGLREEVELGGDDKMRRHEETLTKLPSGIGRVFLDTIRQTQSIRRSKVGQVDPRSAARSPAANKVPKYRLRYDSPAWASPSRDTFHGRPWDSEEDLCQQVVLTSSGCASGCASDHLPHAKSGNLLGRSVPSLHSTLVRPGYTQLNTLPAVRSVSGRILSTELRPEQEGEDGVSGNSHSGVVSSVNNSFSWHTLAKYQEETLNKQTNRNTFFTKPELKHKRTILDI